MRDDFTCQHDPVVKKIFFAMLVPTILMNLTTALASFADTVIIGYFLDDLALSVVTFCTPIYMLINTCAALFAVGGSISMSIEAGGGDKDRANRAFSLAVELLVVSGLVLTFAGLFAHQQVAVWLGPEDAALGMVDSYARIIMVGAPLFMVNTGLAFFVRNDGRPVLSMVGMFLSIAVNIVCDILFVGFLDMGIAGAAWATVLGQGVSVVVIGSHLFSPKNTLRFIPSAEIAQLKQIFSGGISTALHFIYQFLSVFLLNHLVVSLSGNDGMIVYTVVFNLYTVSLALFEGLSQTEQPMISVYYGEKNVRHIRATLRLVFLTALVVCGTVTAAIELYPQSIPLIFGIDSAALMEQSALAVRIFGTSILIMTVNVIMCYYFQSTERNLMSAVLVSLRCFVLFLASAAVLGKQFGIDGVWASYTAAEVLSFFVCLVMLGIQRSRAAKKGSQLDFFLLDREAASHTLCLVYQSGKVEYEGFLLCVDEALSEHGFPASLAGKAKGYLEYLGESMSGRDACCVEAVLMTGNGAKILVYDNLPGREAPSAEEAFGEYSPVLGWNRMIGENNG